MNHLHAQATRLLIATMERLRCPADDDPERGDVPGWVLVTLMSAGLVSALWVVAEPQLADLLDNALSTVSGP